MSTHRSPSDVQPCYTPDWTLWVQRLRTQPTHLHLRASLAARTHAAVSDPTAP